VPYEDLKKYAIYNVNIPVMGTLDVGVFGSSLFFSKLEKSDAELIDTGLESLKRCLISAGAKKLYMSPQRSLARVSALHLFAGCSLGGEVVDSYGQLRGFVNVRVNDTSMLPGSTIVNPQGALMALVWRNMSQFLAECV